MIPILLTMQVYVAGEFSVKITFIITERESTPVLLQSTILLLQTIVYLSCITQSSW